MKNVWYEPIYGSRKDLLKKLHYSYFLQLFHSKWIYPYKKLISTHIQSLNIQQHIFWLYTWLVFHNPEFEFNPPKKTYEGFVKDECLLRNKIPMELDSS